MKKAIYAVFAAIVVALTACGGAHAAPLNENFTANPATTVFSVQGASRVEKVGNGVNVSKAVVVGNPDGTFGGYVKATTAYSDINGTAYANFQAQAAANGFYRVGTTDVYLSAKNAASFNCISGSVSQFVYAYGVEQTSDACSMFQAAKSASN